MSMKNSLYVVAGSIILSIIKSKMKGSRSEDDNIYDMALEMMKRRRQSIDAQVADRQERKQRARETMYNDRKREIERRFPGKVARKKAMKQLDKQFMEDPFSVEAIKKQWGQKLKDQTAKDLGMVKNPSSFRDELEMRDAELGFKPQGKIDRETFFHDHRR